MASQLHCHYQPKIQSTVWGSVNATSVDTLMKHLANTQFATDTDIKQAVSLLCQNTGLGTTLLKWQG